MLFKMNSNWESITFKGKFNYVWNTICLILTLLSGFIIFMYGLVAFILILMQTRISTIEIDRNGIHALFEDPKRFPSLLDLLYYYSFCGLGYITFCGLLKNNYYLTKSFRWNNLLHSLLVLVLSSNYNAEFYLDTVSVLVFIGTLLTFLNVRSSNNYNGFKSSPNEVPDNNMSPVANHPDLVKLRRIIVSMNGSDPCMIPIAYKYSLTVGRLIMDDTILKTRFEDGTISNIRLKPNSIMAHRHYDNNDDERSYREEQHGIEDQGVGDIELQTLSVA